jgi:hypothetical protein
MSNIIVKHFHDKDLTTLHVNGKLSATDIVNHASHSYTTNLVLWDLRRAIVDDISREEFETIKQFMRSSLSMPRAKGKTALVGNDDSDLQLGYMYKQMMEDASIPVKYQVFDSMGDAEEWLGITE